MYLKRKISRCSNRAGGLSLNLLFIVLLLLTNAGYAQTNKNDCPFCYLKGKSFAGKDLTNANFNGAYLDSADFTNAKLDGANFSNASLIGAKFINAKAAVSAKGPVNFSLTNCLGANFSNTSFKNAVFYYANLSAANFTGADLTTARMGPELKVYNSAPAIFKGAKLGCAFIPFVYILDLKGAILPSCMVQPVAQAAKEPAFTIRDIKNPTDCAQTTLVTATRNSLGNRDSTRKNNPKEEVAAGDTLFVSNQGTDTSTCGAVGSPCKTIARAVANCGAGPCTIAVDYGEYTLNAPVSLNGITLVGGFYNGQPTAYQSALFAPPGGLPAIIATGGAVSLSNFILDGSIPAQKNLPSIVLQAQGNSTVTLLNTNINSFKGGMGDDGSGAGKGSDGGTGGNGSNGTGGTPGTSASCPGNAGGYGGNSGYFNKADCKYRWDKAACEQSIEVCWYNGGNGQPGSTGVSAPGSKAAAGVFYFCGSKKRPSITATGTNGTAGACGGSAYPAADTAGKFLNGQWVPATGGSGGVGGSGGGGGGGGCGGYCAYCGCFCGEETYNGTAGGGGGGGGCGALGGQGANMGGASFGVVLINATLVADNTVKITNGAGGDGGTGGAGNSGGAGGAGGNAQSGNNVCNNTGGQGGNGGAGGAGGASSGGAGGNGGPSVGVALVGTSTCSNNLVFYAGKSGNPGSGGAGGTPVTGATCSGVKGNGGILSTVANTRQY
ncbi:MULTISPECIES: pentapeptide repeat-containing protein [Niastella]|uniref:Pentapeptide repeat-containing protein n=1 Tax=Niastella soli TaxID=2821487 RepID=A0ABS3YW46_9BACT|nr:pentapeptide repeat-containing protein [Niastella soli]MBO9202156.1 pentapeptide repeat-containing protein [Niastella soli]